MNKNFKYIFFPIFFYLLIKKAVPKILELKDKYTNTDFLNFIKPIVLPISKEIGVPYKFMLIQIALESSYGRSSLFTKYNNVGGVKAVSGQSFVSLPTYEYINGSKVQVIQNFATYPSLQSGILGYSKILQNKYFKKYQHKTNDPKEYAILLQSGSPKYATDINYVSKIHKLLDTYNV